MNCEFAQSSIFNDIAQESIDFCRISLVSASSLITAREPQLAEVDGQLFLIRHLLVLKEMIGLLKLADRGSVPIVEVRDVTGKSLSVDGDGCATHGLLRRIEMQIH